MRRGPLLAVLVAVAAAWPAQAAAAPERVFRFVPSYGEPYAANNPFRSYAGPQLAGSELVWARAAFGGGWVVERGRGLRVASSARPSEGGNTVHTLRVAGGSPSRVAWTDSAYDVLDAKGMSYRSVRSTVTTATPGGAPTTAVGCHDRESCACPRHCSDHSYPADLDGDVLAYVEGHYPNRAVVVDDLASEDPPLRIEADEIDAFVRIAGDHVAFSQLGFNSQPRTTVYDWRARRELYRIPVPRVADLQADGKLVTTDVSGSLVWYSATEPTPHPIAPPPKRTVGDMRIAGDRIAFTHTRRYGEDPMLAVTDLAGNTKDVAPGPGYGMLAFDGRRAGWMAERCGLIEVLLDPDVDRPGGDPPPRNACVPPRIDDLRIDSQGRIAVKVLCQAGCRGTLGIYRHGGSPVRKLATRRISLGASRRVRTVRLTPSDAGFRAMSTPTGSLRIEARFLGRDGRSQLVGAAQAGKVRHP
jgi:hypothetical protein